MSRIFIGIVICLVSTEMNTGTLWTVGKLKLLFQNQFQRYLRDFLPGKGSQDKFLFTNFHVENHRFRLIFLCLTKSSLHSNTSYMLSTQTKKQTHKKKNRTTLTWERCMHASNSAGSTLTDSPTLTSAPKSKNNVSDAAT